MQKLGAFNNVSLDGYFVDANGDMSCKGRTMFEGVTKRFALKLTSSRTFQNGNVVLRYEPIL
ncbi:MAG TPA: hypothetical protein VHX49_09710 [Candidatus Acidoferrales bacterium]|nr:hypothetical protein [Candidatus Acidoferrales bacterium]